MFLPQARPRHIANHTIDEPQADAVRWMPSAQEAGSEPKAFEFRPDPLKFDYWTIVQ